MNGRLGFRIAMSCSSHLPGFPGCLSAIRAVTAELRGLLSDELDHRVDVFNAEAGDGPRTLNDDDEISNTDSMRRHVVHHEPPRIRRRAPRSPVRDPEHD